MWIFTLDGFYSVVADRDDPALLLVRARAHGDAFALRERLADLGLGRPRIEHTPQADYAYRVRVGRAALAAVLSEECGAIAYDNFKAAVARRAGPTRAAAYGRVWAFLRAALR